MTSLSPLESQKAKKGIGYSSRGIISIPPSYTAEEARIRKKGNVHTLRHTFATHQVHNGLKINPLKEVLGHKKMETTYKYVHLDRTNLRQEMEQGAL
jgi:integrase/recombinase XerD